MMILDATGNYTQISVRPGSPKSRVTTSKGQDSTSLLSPKGSDSGFDGDAANAGPPHLSADRGAEDLRHLECRRHP